LNSQCYAKNTENMFPKPLHSLSAIPVFCTLITTGNEIIGWHYSGMKWIL
jgi:hypothetical protein